MTRTGEEIAPARRTGGGPGTGRDGHGGEETRILEREADVFCRYLLGRPATPYVRSRYGRAHRRRPGLGRPSDAFDRRLLAVARRSPRWAALVDAYARLRRPATPLRRKLVLLAAILEVSPAFSDHFRGTGRGRVRAWAVAAAGCAGFVVRAALALLLLGPLDLASLRPGGAGDAPAGPRDAPTGPEAATEAGGPTREGGEERS